VAIVMPLLLCSCYKEVEVDDGPGEVFELSVSPEWEDLIYSSKDTGYTIGDPGVVLRFNGRALDLKEIRIRGRTSLDFRRKSYAVKLDHPVVLESRDGNEIIRMNRFKLISLCMDYTYINNRVAFGLMEQAGVMPLFFKYVEFRMNGETQGIYFLVEDPEEYFREQGAGYILRRDYHHGIEDSEYDPGLAVWPREDYKNHFLEMYLKLPDFQGEALHKFLGQHVDLKLYFRKMGMDYLLRNGDYTDEIYLYAMAEKDAVRFKPIPWDYDDIFSAVPHEVGRSWGIGKLFGDRVYHSVEDIQEEIGERMVFSIEDDLDYAIARDSFMYARYEQVLADMIGEIEARDISALFDRVKDELTPFYGEEEMVLLSQYDRYPTSLELWQNNMDEKESLLKERLEFMKIRLKP